MFPWKKTLLLLISTNLNLTFCQQNSCYRRRCDQLISGRQLEYRRALQIVQSEQYLTAADLDLVRRRGMSRVKRQAWHQTIAANFFFNGTSNNNILVPEVSLTDVKVMTGVVSLGSLAYLIAPEGPPVLLPPPGFAPAEEPQPGQLGGGSLPIANSIIAAEALSLTPFGTIPVAIFPNFVSPRSVRAVGVIFSELSPRFDRKAHYYHAKNGYNTQSGRGYKNSFRRLGRILDILLRKRRVFRRKFGFVMKVRLVDERCQLDVTCDVDGQRLQNSVQSFNGQRRQTGEEFSSSAPPDCRTFFVGCNN